MRAKIADSNVNRLTPDIQATPTPIAKRTINGEAAPPVQAVPMVASAIQSADSSSATFVSVVEPRTNIPTRDGSDALPRAATLSQIGTPKKAAHDAARVARASQITRGAVI
jgi:hypothetical protein